MSVKHLKYKITLDFKQQFSELVFQEEKKYFFINTFMIKPIETNYKNEIINK
jgi:hypothetical protein